MREQQHVANRRRIGEQHDQAIDADAEPAGRRHAVLERAQVVLVQHLRLLVAALARSGDAEGALEQLAKVNPADERKIRALQQQIAVVDSWQQWLAEAVNEGITAQSQLVEVLGN